MNVARVLVACLFVAVAAAPAADAKGPPAAGPPAKVVFMTPTRWGMHVSIYRVTEQGQEFIGLLSKHQKIEYAAAPGDALFMIIGGENADFLQAHLDGGKTYYAIARQRTGWIRARYSLLAVRRQGGEYSLDDKDLPGWLADCETIQPSDKDRAWYEKNLPSIERKREAYLRKWNARDEEFKERQVLEREDGQ